MYQSYFICLLLMLLFYVSFLFFLVTCNNDLFMPVLIVNFKVNEAPAIPAGIPITVACEATLNEPNDADKVINILSRSSKPIIYLFNLLIIYFFHLFLY